MFMPYISISMKWNAESAHHKCLHCRKSKRGLYLNASAAILFLSQQRYSNNALPLQGVWLLPRFRGAYTSRITWQIDNWKLQNKSDIMLHGDLNIQLETHLYCWALAGIRLNEQFKYFGKTACIVWTINISYFIFTRLNHRYASHLYKAGNVNATLHWVMCYFMKLSMEIWPASCIVFF